MQTYYYHLFTSFVPEVVTVLRGKHIENGLSSPPNRHRHRHRKNIVYAHTENGFSEY